MAFDSEVQVGWSRCTRLTNKAADFIGRCRDGVVGVIGCHWVLARLVNWSILLSYKSKTMEIGSKPTPPGECCLLHHSNWKWQGPLLSSQANAFHKLGSLADSQVRKQTWNLNCLLHPFASGILAINLRMCFFSHELSSNWQRWPVWMGCLFGRSPCVQDLMSHGSGFRSLSWRRGSGVAVVTLPGFVSTWKMCISPGAPLSVAQTHFNYFGTWQNPTDLDTAWLWLDNVTDLDSAIHAVHAVHDVQDRGPPPAVATQAMLLARH